MKIKTLLTILLSISFAFTFAQNEKINRDEYTLKILVNEEQYYVQKLGNYSAPYYA